MRPVPVLVTEIPSEENGGISEDGTTLTFKLRDDIVWSDGTPITSEDFLFTVEMFLEPTNTVQINLSVRCNRIDRSPGCADGCQVNFAEPFAPWLAWMWRSILPAHISATRL